MMGSMRLVVIGAGTLAPHPTRSPAGYVVDVGEGAGGERLLVDCGSGTYHRAHRLGLSLASVSRVLLTHHHPDHTLDLAHLLFAFRYLPPARTAPLEVIGGPGTASLLDRIHSLYGDWVRPTAYRLSTTEVRPGDSIDRGAWRATVHAVRHDASSVAYRIEADGVVVALTGDSDVTPGLAEAGCAADLLVLECSNPDGEKVAGHLTPSEAGAIAAEAGARLLLLTHRYPTCDGHDVAAAARARFGGRVLVAEDGFAWPA